MIAGTSRSAAAEGLCTCVGPGYGPSRFARCALGLGKCRQELSRQETALQYDIDNASGLRNFLRPLNRLVTIIERPLQTSVESDLVPRHDASHSTAPRPRQETCQRRWRSSRPHSSVAQFLSRASRARGNCRGYRHLRSRRPHRVGQLLWFTDWLIPLGTSPLSSHACACEVPTKGLIHESGYGKTIQTKKVSNVPSRSARDGAANPVGDEAVEAVTSGPGQAGCCLRSLSKKTDATPDGHIEAHCPHTCLATSGKIAGFQIARRGSIHTAMDLGSVIPRPLAGLLHAAYRELR